MICLENFEVRNYTCIVLTSLPGEGILVLAFTLSWKIYDLGNNIIPLK